MTINSELLTALENERRYVARELHDNVAQTVQQLGLHGGICRKLADLGEVEKLLEQLEGLESRIQLASTQIREMISDLRKPLIGRSSGLLEYIEYAIETHKAREGANITYRNRLDEEIPNLSVEQILTLYRIAQESLFNIRKHAKAKNILVDLAADEKNLYLTIADDGIGFDVAAIKERPPDKGGAGVANLQARAHAIGGTLLISKGTTAGGTAILATIPLGDQPWW
ncbi:histidine kinase [Anaerolineales bacterium HSG24]|nr:histidine kinase [Anaerolineales bacterium HSG24]